VDYIQPTVETMVPLLDFYFHEDVRKAAVASLPDILRAGKAAADEGKVPGGGDGKQYFASLVNFVVPPLVAALAKEPGDGDPGCDAGEPGGLRGRLW
jgi:hypothetical protein